MYLLYSRRQDYPIVGFKSREAAERQLEQMNNRSRGMFYVRNIEIR